MAIRKKQVTERRKSHILKGDRVRVIRGNHRDHEGKVLRVLRDEGKVVVEGVNMRKRHTRPNPQNTDGGIISFEAPIHVSNVMLVDPTSGDATRVRVKAGKEGKERIAVKSGNPIPRPR